HFFFQAEDGIRDRNVTGVQTCALPICSADTKWCIIGPPSHVFWQAELPADAVVTSYSITSANDVPERDPQDWTLQGSQDGEAWRSEERRVGKACRSRRARWRG